MPLLHILQEGASTNDFMNNIHTHQSCSDGQNVSLYHTNFLDILTRQNADHNQFEYSLPVHQRNRRDSQLAGSCACLSCTRSCRSGTEILAWPQLSPCRRGANDASKPSTSTATSEPSSTLDNLDACEIAPVRLESHQQSSDTRIGEMQRLKDVTQHSCQTSLDEGSSMQESMPHVTNRGEDVCRTVYPADEGCSFDNCSIRNVHKQAGTGECAIVPRPPARKRKRSRGFKNSEEVESQRMTHIAVERNRRRQMNEHLIVLRSLMPSTYIQRGDQASIIGGAIDFVKELEHVLQALQNQRTYRDFNSRGYSYEEDESSIFKEHVKKQQFPHHARYASKSFSDNEFAHVTCEGIDVDVRLNGKCALVKVLAQKLPHQLLKVILSIESLHMRIMHLNITTIDKSVLYSFNLELQSDSEFQSANGVAHLVQSIFRVDNEC
ncbi:hypothetical protein GOP47_0000632 [Adiantum capillus-veneris]|uniref:BHLH domain-containing protein n=1 Tax=Adiantum capillus-veneris TaxID=13818 RepID=A0A9D4VDW7_ADICA|nr:hypothetical protein GOP47_0000632 [Adiantum capillus-veneris]